MQRKEQHKNRIGETNYNYSGELMKIIEYNNATNIMIQFEETKELVKCEYSQFKDGRVRSHLKPHVFNVGITENENTRDEKGNKLKSYKAWNSMLERSYSEKFKNKQPVYKDVTCCDEWKYYKNFKKWFDNNYYEIEGQRMHLDKDILHKGNKIYSPDSCLIVPAIINTLFINCRSNRGEYPIGVYLDKRYNKYKSQCNVFDMNTNKTKRISLGRYNTSLEAFNNYKDFKESYIKEVADYYKNKIPNKLYDAMINYKIEIID
jgi:hypothetical protein